MCAKHSMEKYSDIFYINHNLKITIKNGKFQEKRNKSLEDIEKFWAEEAKNLLWFKYWDKILRWNPPFAKWFDGGSLNASVNCLDKHVESDNKNKVALIWEGENGESRILTYYQLYCYVNQFSNALKSLNVTKGDRVTIYLPMIPEILIAILACSRIGAIHNVVFSGFSQQALADRINDAESKIIITADGGFRRGKLLELKSIVDQTIPNTPSVQNVVVFKRASNPVNMTDKDVWWHDIIKNQSSYCQPEQVESTHPLFILYTSGTTAEPKGIVHGTAGYLTHTYSTAKWVFNFNKQDIFFCTADIGWITGHSYIVYAPLMHGVTELIYEGTPDYPHPDRYWALVEKYGVSILYTTPTALRTYMRYENDIPNSFNLSSLRLLGTVGEPINPQVWMWYFTIIGKERCAIVDTWWQTETGGIMISHCTGIETMPMKPGSAMFPIPGIDIDVVDEENNHLSENQKGYLVVKKPWPGMFMTLWKDDDKYKKNYWKKIQKNLYYFTGDYAIIDNESYFWLLGRTDDVIKVSGHRLSTIELESTFISHRSVSEAAVTSKPDNTKGQSIVAFVVLKTGFVGSKELHQELVKHLRKSIGPIATPEQIYFVNKLPKTRSGKIMRRLLKSIVSDLKISDTTTLEDGTSIEEIQKMYNELNKIVR